MSTEPILVFDGDSTTELDRFEPGSSGEAVLQVLLQLGKGRLRAPNGYTVTTDTKNLPAGIYRWYAVQASEPEQRRASGAAAGPSGAPVPAARALPELRLVELLQRPMPDVKIDPVASASSQVHGFSELIIEKWTMSADDHRNINAYVEAEVGNLTIPNPTQPEIEPGFEARSEDQSNTAFFDCACKRSNAIYNAKNVHLMWEKNGKSGQPDNTVPDFVLKDRDTEEEVMVFEGKFVSVLNVLRLAQLYNAHKRDPKARDTRATWCYDVSQICTYMKTRRRRYGGLTTFRSTFFIKYLGPNRYAVTDAYYNTLSRPSVPAIMFYLAGKCKAEGPVPTEPPPRALRSTTRQHGAPPAGEPPSKVAKTPRGRGGGRGGGGRGGGGGGASSSNTLSLISWDELTLEEELGQGMCGAVSKGRLFGQPVAVKCVDACNSSHLVPVLQHEAAVLGRLSNLQGVCVPALRACGYWEDGICFVLATTVIPGVHPVPGQQSALSRAAALEALRAIHAQGVAHGDIREENILVEEEGKVWFLDFGLAKLDPTREERERELRELEGIFASGSPGSAACGRPYLLGYLWWRAG